MGNESVVEMESETSIENRQNSLDSGIIDLDPPGPQEDLVKPLLQVENTTTTTTRKKRILDGHFRDPLKISPSQLTQIILGRNPISILNEIFSTLIYEVESKTGPAHDPCYVMSLKVKNVDEKFLGTGPSKKLARNKAALRALTVIFKLEQKPIIGDGMEKDLVTQTLLDSSNVIVEASSKEKDWILKRKGNYEKMGVVKQVTVSRGIKSVSKVNTKKH